MLRSFTPTSWCPRRSSRRLRARRGRDLRSRPPPLGSVHVCYWGYALDAPNRPAAGGGRHCRGAGRDVNTRTTSDPHRPLPALRPAPTRPGRRCRPGIRNSLPPKPAICWSLRPSSTAHRTVSCSADRAGSATPAAEGSRRRASSRGPASTRSPRPASGHRMRICPSSRAPAQGGTLLERSLDCGSVAEALVDLVPGTVSASPRPVWRRRPRARNRRRRGHPDQLLRAGAVSAGPRFFRAPFGLWRPGSGGVKVGICPLFRCRACPGLARHPPWGSSLMLAVAWRWPAAPTNTTTVLPAGRSPHPPRHSPMRRCRGTPRPGARLRGRAGCVAGGGAPRHRRPGVPHRLRHLEADEEREETTAHAAQRKLRR